MEGKCFAMKKIDKYIAKQQNYEENIKLEIEILKNVSHPFIINL